MVMVGWRVSECRRSFHADIVAFVSEQMTNPFTSSPNFFLLPFQLTRAFLCHQTRSIIRFSNATPYFCSTWKLQFDSDRCVIKIAIIHNDLCVQSLCLSIKVTFSIYCCECWCEEYSQIYNLNRTFGPLNLVCCFLCRDCMDWLRTTIVICATKECKCQIAARGLKKYTKLVMSCRTLILWEKIIS